ncbi:MAG: hypothetical protein ICV60_20295 [Pyrinomonadaceae bacterium]|nr:hypothetical protein [Pyrinomonadaceae bacterium]
MPAEAVSKNVDATSSSVSAGAFSPRGHALANPKDSSTQRPASKPNRGKNSPARDATSLPEKFGLMKAASRLLHDEASASPAYSSFALSRPKGRAPPAAL